MYDMKSILTNWSGKIIPVILLHCLYFSASAGNVPADSRATGKAVTEPPAKVAGIITGQVTSIEGETLPGVTIMLKGTTTGTITDADGRYSIDVPDGSGILVFSYVGFTSEEVSINNRSTIDLVMSPDIQQLQEVVVVGYGTVKKSDLTGSVSSVKAEELAAYPTIGTVQALQGRAAGVQISASNGEPGAAYKIRIRGGNSITASSDPIYVVDGFVGASPPPAEDIASIDILKDASATAIYGSRGANGVIMITTKKGTAGKTKIDFNASYSSQEVINRLDLLNASQFVDYMQDVNPDFQTTGKNTDWQDEIFRQGGIRNYQLGISGGTEDVQYYLSGTYFDQEGIILGSQYERYSITSNINLNASERFRVGVNLFARRTKSEGVRTQETSGGATNTGVVAAAFKFEPDQGIYDDNGNFTLARLNDKHDNPYAIATQRQNEEVSDRFQGNLYGEYDILDNLKFRVTVGASTDNGRDGTYIPTSLVRGRGIGGEGSMNGDKNSLFLNENYLTYSKNFGWSNLTVMGGYSYQHSRSTDWGGRGSRFVTDNSSFWNLGGSSEWMAPNSGTSEWELSSWYGRVNYAVNDKYLLTFNARYDGSSTFSKNYKWAFFPSGAFAWNMKQEPFMNDVGWVSQLKWRISYGATGNRAISPYGTLAAFEEVLAIQGGVPVNAVAPERLPNDNLTWETTYQFDIGVDMGMFNNRLQLTADYYKKKTVDMIFRKPLPEYIGLSDLTFTSNIGKLENKGFELALNSRNLVGEFEWSTGFNISYNKNKILELPDGNDIDYDSEPSHMVGIDKSQILREGEPVGVFYGWIYDGVYQEGDEFLPGGGFEQSAGGEKYRDIDGTRDDNGELTGIPDGMLNNDDRTVIGNPHPDFIWGLNNTFSWKGFDMNIFFQASQGSDILSYTLMELDLLSGLNNATTNALDRWTPDNTDTDVPKAVGGRARRVSTRWIYDGSYIRLKNLSIGYTLPQSLTEKIRVQKLRFYVSAQNLLTFTDYEGFDPEVHYRSSGSTDGNRNLGLDYGSYPNAKSITVGLNLSF